MRIFTTPTFAAGLLAFPGFALAQDEPAPHQMEEDEILVTGQGLETPLSITAYATSEIDRDQIVAAPSGRIEEVLAGVAGFQQFRRSDSRSANPSAQGVTLRGIGGNATSRALVLLDGVPMTDPFFGYVPFAALSPETLQSIRVTRGGGSGPFGAGALTGVIELQSAAADQLGPVSGSLLVNDREETEASVSLASDLGSGFGVISARWDRGQGFFTTPENDRVPATARAAFDSWSVGLRGVAPLNDTVELQAKAQVFRDDRTLRFDDADSSSEGQDASIRIVGRGEWEFDALGYVQARNFSNVVISSTRFVRVLDQRNTPSTGLGGKIEIRPPVGDAHTLRIGMDYRRADGELQEEAYSAFTGALRERRRAGGVNSDLGLFIEDDWWFGPLILTGGLRADRTSITDGFYRAVDASGELVSETRAADRSEWSASWRAGAGLDIARGLHIRAAAYTGLRLPTLNELYRPFVVFPVVTQANADLRNERLRGYEAGLDFTGVRGLRASVTVFDNRVKNAIANVTLEENLRQRQNLPAIDAQGVEAGMSYEVGGFRFEGSASFTDAEIDGSGTSLALDGNRPPQSPRFAGSAAISWRSDTGLRLGAQVRHFSSQFEDDQETDVLPAATTIGAFAQIPVATGWAVTLRGENLTDEEIVTRNSSGAIDLGVPRTFWAGLRYGF